MKVCWQPTPFQLFYRSADFSPGFPRRKGLIIQAENLTAGKQRPVVLTLGPAVAFAVNVEYCVFHRLLTFVVFCRYRGFQETLAIFHRMNYTVNHKSTGGRL